MTDYSNYTNLNKNSTWYGNENRNDFKIIEDNGKIEIKIRQCSTNIFQRLYTHLTGKESESIQKTTIKLDKKLYDNLNTVDDKNETIKESLTTLTDFSKKNVRNHLEQKLASLPKDESDHRILAENGDVKSQIYLGNLCYSRCSHKNGRGTKLHSEEALKFFKMTADQGNTEAQFRVACLYLFGRPNREHGGPALEKVINTAEGMKYLAMAESCKPEDKFQEEIKNLRIDSQRLAL